MNTDVQRGALEAMAKTQLPMDYPIHFHFWSGDLRAVSSDALQPQFGPPEATTHPRPAAVPPIRPLDNVAFESEAPYHGSEGTSQKMGTPAGLVRTIKEFKELGNLAEDERTIAQKAMGNVIRFYRPDLSIVTMPVPVPQTIGTAIPAQSAATANATTRGPVNNRYTMFDLTAVFNAECVGPHLRCASVYLVSDGHREGAILGRDWNHVLTGLTDVPNLRNSKIFSAVQLILCCWGGGLLRDRPQEMMQFLQELLGDPPQEAASFSTDENDIKLAIRKRFHGCRVAHVWLKNVQPPFRYECGGNLNRLQPEVQDAFTTISRAMTSALAAVHGQFVTRYHEDSSSTRPAIDEELQLVEEERYDEDDQAGPSQHANLSGSGPSQAQQQRFSQTRNPRGAPQ